MVYQMILLKYYQIDLVAFNKHYNTTIIIVLQLRGRKKSVEQFNGSRWSIHQLKVGLNQVINNISIHSFNLHVVG